MTIGRAAYQPGWKWSEDVGSAVNETYCRVENVGMVVSGSTTAAMSNGETVEMKPGDLFYVPPSPMKAGSSATILRSHYISWLLLDTQKRANKSPFLYPPSTHRS